MCLVLAVSLSSHQISEKGPGCTRWIFIYIANIFCISFILKCTLILSRHQISKAPSSCLRARQIFVKCQNWQILQFKGVNLTKKIYQVSVSWLFKNEYIQRDWHYDVIKYFGVFKFMCNYMYFGGDKICGHFWQNQTNLLKPSANGTGLNIFS